MCQGGQRNIVGTDRYYQAVSAKPPGYLGQEACRQEYQPGQERIGISRVVRMTNSDEPVVGDEKGEEDPVSRRSPHHRVDDAGKAKQEQWRVQSLPETQSHQADPTDLRAGGRGEMLKDVSEARLKAGKVNDQERRRDGKDQQAEQRNGQ